jgi:hypothetical protein
MRYILLVSVVLCRIQRVDDSPLCSDVGSFPLSKVEFNLRWYHVIFFYILVENIDTLIKVAHFSTISNSAVFNSPQKFARLS